MWLEDKAPRPLRKRTHHGFQRPVMQPMVEHPQRCTVPDKQHLLTIVLGGEIRQEATHPRRHLLVTLAVGERFVDRRRAHAFDFRARASCQVAIIALPQPCVAPDGYRMACEDERCGVIGALSVGRIDDVEAPASVSGAQNGPRLLPPVVAPRPPGALALTRAAT